MNSPNLPSDLVARLAAEALAEDVGSGDITTSAVVPPGLLARGTFIAREEMIVCGLPLARAIFAALDPAAIWREMRTEGDAAKPGDLLAEVEGAAPAILTGERSALNFLQRLSGIATEASKAVKEVEGTGAVILDTRKTTPTLRAVEKYAVAVGGGQNHRFGLADAVLIKDNHVALAGGVAAAFERAVVAGHPADAIEIEVDTLEGVREALGAGARRLLLDNFTPTAVAEAVRTIAGRAIVEVSGGLRPGLLRAYAEAGADSLSLGSLTHSARAVDISLEVAPLGS